MDPDRIDREVARGRFVAAHARHEAAEHEAPEEERRLEEGASKELEEDGHGDHREGQPNVLARAEEEDDVAVLVAGLRRTERRRAAEVVLGAEHAAADVLDARRYQ